MSKKKDWETPLFGPEAVISSYTRAEAIADEVLIDVSTLAKEAGFKCPVAISIGIRVIIHDAIMIGKKNNFHFDYEGIVWDILQVLLVSIKMQSDTNRIDFAPLIYDKYQNKVVPTKMYSVAGPGDNEELVLTIMLPHED